MEALILKILTPEMALVAFLMLCLGYSLKFLLNRSDRRFRALQDETIKLRAEMTQMHDNIVKMRKILLHLSDIVHFSIAELNGLLDGPKITKKSVEELKNEIKVKIDAL